jgi:LytS/YehU family sensor histidine kinase
MMTSKKVFRTSGFLSVGIIILMVIFKDAKSELPAFLSLCLGGVILFSILYFLFEQEKNTKSKIPVLYKYIFYGISIPVLITIINLTKDTGKGFLFESSRVLLAIEIFYLIFSSIYNHIKKIKDLKSEKTTAELILLKEQINPHFFFNSLNSLYSLIKKDPDKAQEYVLKLSDMIRFTVYEGKKDTVSLKDEITYLKNYIDLNISRYHKNIDIQFNDHIENTNTQVAPLLYIILLENAFKHGVEILTDNAFVHIDFSQSESEIYFEIKNNFDEQAAESTPGIGIDNLKNRLELLYKNKYDFQTSKDKNVYCTSIKINLA